MPVIGTAGHVDHGKSTLIRALTGRDPDRLAEEKQRGLTIDLGFAWTAIGDVTVGFVDVPGHERFIKNMLAGIEAVQGVLFVVACDEGWMPQSEEHLAIVDLLGLRAGVVALTRRDLVDDDTATLARLEVEEKLQGTSLQGAAIIEVSPPQGLGLDELRRELGRLVGEAEPGSGRVRMWVDRSFTIAGAGTVVTGTLLGDDVGTGDELAVWPGPIVGRVRSLQSHEQQVDRVKPGTRTAINLGGLEASAIERGAMIGRPGEWLPTRRILADLREARGMEDVLADRGAYHLHAGSGAWPMRLRLLEDGAALIQLGSEIPLTMGDRFIIRDVGRRAVVGGGRVLDPSPPPRPRPDSVDDLRAVIEASGTERATALVTARGRVALADLAAHSGGEPAGVVIAGSIAFSDTELARLRAAAADLVESFHRQHPLRPGMPTASLAERLRLDVGQLPVVLGDGLVLDGGSARLAGFRADLDDAQQAAYDEMRTQLESGLAVPRASQLAIDLELRHALERRGDLVRIEDDLVYLPEQVEEIKHIVSRLGEGFSVADFRDACGISRRQAVPLLEWLDRAGYTERSGDLRRSKI